MATSPCVVPLLSQTAINASIFGAKASNLAKAAQLGFPVPSGLAVPRTCTEGEFSLITQDIL